MRLFPNLYSKIMLLWDKYHLNDMQAGCIHQEAEQWNKILLDPGKPATQDNMAIWTYPDRTIPELLAHKLWDLIPWKYRTIKDKIRSLFHGCFR